MTTIGYSTQHSHADVHPADCDCGACIDVRLLHEDVETTIDGWLSLRREDVQREAEAQAAQMLAAHDEWLATLADQREDYEQWRWSVGDVAL